MDPFSDETEDKFGAATDRLRDITDQQHLRRLEGITVTSTPSIQLYDPSPLNTDPGITVTSTPSTGFDIAEEPFRTLRRLEIGKLNIDLLHIFDEIKPDADYMLKENPILFQITERVGRKIREIIDKDDRVEILLFSDIGLPHWNDFTILVKIRNRTFGDRIDLWKKIEEDVGSVLDQVKTVLPQYAAEIESINRNLTVIVEEF